MADTLDRAIEKLRDLPLRKRREAAAVIEQFIAEAAEPVHKLTDEERALVEEGLAELDRGEFATQAEVDAVFARFRHK